MVEKIILFLRVWKVIKLDKNEINFIKFLKKKKIYPKQNKILIINSLFSYFNLVFVFLLSIEKKYRAYHFIFYKPHMYFYRYDLKDNILIFIIKYYKSLLLCYFMNCEFLNFFKFISKKSFNLVNKDIFKEIYLLNIAKKIIANINCKTDLQKIKFRGILIGDSIYDTYLRFKNVGTVDLKDPFLIEIISKSIFAIIKLDNMFANRKPNLFLTPDTSYIQHGILLKFFLKKKIPSYTFESRVDYLKKIIWINNSFKNFKKYKSIFSKFIDKKSKLNEAKKLLKEKFNGKIIDQEKWMPHSAYKSSTKIHIKNKIKCAIFLHCFVDAPLNKGGIIFDDYNDWIIKTLDFLREKKMQKKTIIKPHPNSQCHEFDLYIKKKYPEFIWVDRKVSNYSIFKLKPEFGLSVLGTILHEMAYYNIYPIACGHNPNISYKFVTTCKNQKEYFNILNKCSQKKIKYNANKNEIYEMVYCHYLNEEMKENLIAKKLNLKALIDEKKSISLIKFINSFQNLKLNHYDNV
jgi:hypothetical protein